MEKKELSIEGLVQLVFDNSRTLLVVVVIAMGLGYGASYLIKPKFKSTLILYPTSQNSISESIIRGGKGFLDFGDEVQVEKMLQVLNSNEIRDYIIKRYDLYKQYEIEPKSKNAWTHVIEQYKSNFQFKKNEFM